MNDQLSFQTNQHPQKLKRMKPDDDAYVTHYNQNVPLGSSHQSFYYNPKTPSMKVQDSFNSQHEAYIQNHSYTDRLPPSFPKSEIPPTFKQTTLYPTIINPISINNPKDPHRNVGMDTILTNATTTNYMGMLLDQTPPSQNFFSKESNQSQSLHNDRWLDLQSEVNGFGYTRDPCLSDTMMMSNVMQGEEPFGQVSEAWLDSYL